jgi:hypothetical protein
VGTILDNDGTNIVNALQDALFGVSTRCKDFARTV